MNVVFSTLHNIIYNLYNMNKHQNNQWNRRKFVSAITAATVASAISLPKKSMANFFYNDDVTIQQVIDMFIKTIPSSPFKETVDTIKAGDASQKVTGIVTTMFATIDVIEKTAALGANFIIAHEPTFYNHLDETKWLKDDEVYQYKLSLLNKHNIVVWRCHDYIHAHNPDGVLMGTLDALEWNKYYDTTNPNVINIPSTSLKEIINHTKNKLAIEHVKFVGNLSQDCKKIVLLPGASGGTKQIECIEKYKPDLLIVGEVNEWETSEYVRDLQAIKQQTSLLVLGHIVSEEAGLQWMKAWLDKQLPQIKTTHIPSKDAFSWG